MANLRKKSGQKAKTAPRAIPRRVRARPQTIPRALTMRGGFNIYDPRCPYPPPTALSVGRGTWVKSDGVYSHTPDLTSGTNRVTGIILGIINTGNIVGIQCDSAAVNPMYTNFFGTLAGSGGATAGKVARLGVEVLNTTKRLDQEGKVYSWVADNRFGEDLSISNAGTTSAWLEDMIPLPMTKSHQASALGDKPLRLFSHPTDQNAYDAFEAWNGRSRGTWANFYSVTGSTAPRPMASLVIAFAPTTVAQTYEIRVSAQWYHRYSSDDSRIVSQQQIPTAPLPMINDHRDQLEDWNVGGRLKTFGDFIWNHGGGEAAGRLVEDAMSRVAQQAPRAAPLVDLSGRRPLRY